MWKVESASTMSILRLYHWWSQRCCVSRIGVVSGSVLVPNMFNHSYVWVIVSLLVSCSLEVSFTVSDASIRGDSPWLGLEGSTDTTLTCLDLGYFQLLSTTSLQYHYFAIRAGPYMPCWRSLPAPRRVFLWGVLDNERHHVWWWWYNHVYWWC